MPIATRLTNTGTLLVNGSFDEFTGAPVVDSSLKLWLDAAQTTSYPGSGSTWTDLSGNANNGTLVNSPSFISNDGGGCIQLDGINDYITLPTTGFAPASLTIDYWIKRISDNGYFWLIDNSDQPELRMLFKSSGKLQIYFYDDGAYFSTALSNTTFSTGSWYNITATLTNGSQNVYINGNQEILTTTGTYTGGPSGNAGEHTLGTYNRPGAGYGGYANVRIGSYRFYNRVLTAAEVLQNYNALQSRYGLESSLIAEALVVGGGGAGGHLGGGGAGGHRYFTNQSLVSNTNYTVTVGAGGTASTGATGNQGSNSVFNIYTSAGGGGGAGEAALPAAGGSGGGGGGISGTSRPGAAGNTPSTSPSQGNTGGNGNDNGAGTAFAGGGGGGAGGTGDNASGTTTAGNGGLGTTNSITGSSVTRAAGGGGGAYQLGGTGTAGTGGSSIGGNGGRNGLNATSGSPNTGSGGGGNGYTSAGNLQGSSGAGGSGVVILKYPNTFTISNSGGGLTFTTDSSSVAGYNITTFTAGTGNISFTALTKICRTTSNTVFAGTLDEFTGAPVVDSNLKLWLDAAQTTSYPGSGTTWTDLSGSGFNGTLTSGPTFSSADGGSIVFDGTDDYVITGFIDIISGNNITVEVWVNCGSSQNQYANILDFNHSNLGFVIQQDSTTLNTFYFAYHNGSGYEITPTITLPTNTWCQLVFVKSGTSTIGYLNSVNTISYTGSANIASTVLNLALGRWLGGGGREFNGKISNTKLYNRALTAAEITQNYNALQSRYGLASVTATQMPVVQRQQSSGTLLVNGEFDEFTGAPIVDSGLKLWLDSAQTTSYPGSGTTWTDLSGNGNNGTLINGVGFDGSNGGGLVFDGSNDYVDLNTNNIITGTNPFTFSCFYTITAFNGGGEIFGNYGTGYTTNYLWISGEYGAYLDGAVYFPGAPLSAGTYHMAVTRDSGGAVILYKNGVQVNSGTLANSIAVGQNFRLGADVNIPGERLNGKIYNQMVYNRALTTDEITTNFNALRNRYGI